MNNNATFITKQQLKFLKEMDSWLVSMESDSLPNEDVETIRKTRELISSIEDKGYYYENESELLNWMREEYIKYKKKYE